MADEKTTTESKADEKAKPATATETAAAQALTQVEEQGMTPEEVHAGRIRGQQAEQGHVVEELLQNPPKDDEYHTVSDLMASSSRLFGLPPEMVAGAAHHAGLEMTDEVSVVDLAHHVKAYMALPA